MQYNTPVVKRARTLMLLFLGVGIANLIRAAMAVHIAPVLEAWPVAFPLSGLAVFYLAWGVIFVGAAWHIWRGAREGATPRSAFPLALTYQLGLWGVALFAYRASYARSLWSRDLVLTVAFLASVAFLARGEA